MFQRTTNFIFKTYGEVLSKHTQAEGSISSSSRIRSKDASVFEKYDEQIYLSCSDGIALVVILKDDQTYDTFVLHRTIRLHKDVYFAVVSISNTCKIEVNYKKSAKKVKHTVSSSNIYRYERIVPSIHIPEIYGCFYQVRGANYVFPGEKHTYWELTFIDNGEMETTIEEDSYTLHSYDYILYGPNQYHTQQTTKHSCSYLTILFDMELEHPELLMNRVYLAHRQMYDIIARFIRSSKESNLYDEDLMLCHVKELIIYTLQYDFHKNVPVASTPIQQRIENELLHEIVNYIHENIGETLFIEDLCEKFSISRSSLQKLFKYNLNQAPKQYISNLKLEMSKRMIKEEKYTISEIATQLGYGSIHHFSKKFKEEYKVSPTQYAKKVMID